MSHVPSGWLCGYPQLHRQRAVVEARQLAKRSLSEVDVLGAFSTSSASVDDPNEDALLGRVTDYKQTRFVSESVVVYRKADLRSRNLKHLGRVVQPSRVRAAANEPSCRLVKRVVGVMSIIRRLRSGANHCCSSSLD